MKSFFSKENLILVVMILLLVGTGVQAGNIKLVTGDWEPYTSEEMEDQGVFTRIVNEVFKEMEDNPKYEFYPWKRTTQYVKNNKAWAAFPYSPTSERKKEFLFSDPIAYSTNKFFYYQDGASIEYNELKDLNSYTIGGVSGSFYVDMFKEAGIRLDYAPTEELALRKLVAGRTDLLPFDELVGWELIKDSYPNKVDDFGTLSKPLTKDPLCLMVAKDYPNGKKLLKEFNAALKTIKEKGIYQEILSKYNVKY